jgi:hypothetical protein
MRFYGKAVLSTHMDGNTPPLLPLYASAEWYGNENDTN